MGKTIELFANIGGGYEAIAHVGEGLAPFDRSCELQKEAFQNWLRNEATRDYTERTIYKYIRALEKVGEWLDIKLESSVFSISSIDNFDKLDQIIRDSQRFEEVNRSHGNGDLSVALSAYRKFLVCYKEKMTAKYAHYNGLGKIRSWTIVDRSTVVKHCDKSFFEHKGSGIPKGITSFFGAEEMTPGETKNISILFEGKFYQGRVSLGSTEHRQVRIFWGTDLSEAFGKYNTPGAMAAFRKTTDDTYEVSLWQQEEQRAWLLSWNPNAWNWKDYDQAVRETHGGKKYNCRWSCTNTHVKPGDRIYLTIVGMKVQNGIVASGVAMSENFADSHWDPDRVAAGGKARFVHVEFDWINDIRQGNVLSQATLKAKFPEQQWSPMASGIAILDKYTQSLEEEWNNFNGLLGGETEMTIKEKVAAIKAYIAARGFNYEGDLIENFYLSLKSKPFVILAGTSGTGKTKLVEYFAEAIGAKMQLVPVRPDWSDSSDLFGHKDLSGNFHPGAIIDFIKSATDSPSVPHFLCLDEMNLARVEYYMSDMLSIIETRRFNDLHKVVTKPLIAKDYCICANGRNDYGELGIPDNLYIIGTVNMDETTFPFSKKVLDRANTIEFSFVDLTRKAIPFVQKEAQELDNSFLKAEYLHLIDCGDDQLIDDICLDLNVWNQILVKANLHVGYRVRDEICFYMMNNKKSELLDFEIAFDHEIMQKILPRVQGSSSAIKDVLSELFVKCAGDYTGFDGTAACQMKSYLDTKPCKYPNSANKIAFMMRRYEEDGFTSYWI